MSKNTNVLKAASNYFWYSRGRFIIDNADIDQTSECRELAETAFMAGAQWQFRESCKMSPHIARFIEMVTLLWGEDTYAALTTGLRAETGGATPGSESADSDCDVSAMSDAF